MSREHRGMRVLGRKERPSFEAALLGNCEEKIDLRVLVAAPQRNFPKRIARFGGDALLLRQNPYRDTVAA